MFFRLPLQRQIGLIDWAILVFFITPAALLLSFLEPETKWNNVPIDTKEHRLFSPHYELHPHHYTMDEQLDMFDDISIIAMAYDPLHLSTLPAFYTFKRKAKIGEPAPDFELKTSANKLLKLSSEQGKINAFMFVALTCPPAQLQIPKWQALARKYSNEDVQFFVIYSRERHPGEGGYFDFEHTKTNQQKMDNAKKLASLTSIKVVVDGINEKVLNAYGDLPNPAYVVNQKGIVVFKSTWADAGKIEQVVDSLLEFKREKFVPSESK
jgi:thiol-disulfide isomerase/thioredoxin